MELEKRAFSANWRVEGERPRVVEGYAALYDVLSVDLGGFRERIARGAFARALTPEADVRALINHDESLLIGRTRSDTLRLSDDDRGLRVRIELPDTSYARDLAELLARGDINQMSFAFRAVRDRFEKTGKEVVRILEEIELYDVSIVTYPAYPQTTAELRALIERAGEAAAVSTAESYLFLIRLLKVR